MTDKSIKSAGRRKGSKNKSHMVAKDNITAVFTRLGGTAAMARWAKRNQTEFYKLYARLIPHEHTGPDGAPIQFQRIERTIIDP